MAFFTDKLKALSETYEKIESKLGIRRFIQYSLFLIAVYAVFNFNYIVEVASKIQAEFDRKEHEKRLIMRDKLLMEVNPLLIELRSSTGASRVLYFEYHNSTENFVGIPFKFINLVLSNQEYGCEGYDPSKFQDINSGLISGLYNDLRKKEVIVNKGIENDTIFYDKYPGVYEYFITSGKSSTTQQVFVNIPGINFPIGLIVLEWIEHDPISEKEWEYILKRVDDVLPRINGVINKYTP